MFQFNKNELTTLAPALGRIGFLRFGVLPLLLSFTVLAGCNSSKIPCPKIGGKQKFALFRKKADPAKPNEAGFGQSQLVGYDKNGLMKKKSYKSLKKKPRR